MYAGISLQLPRMDSHTLLQFTNDLSRYVIRVLVETQVQGFQGFKDYRNRVKKTNKLEY